MTPLQKLVHDWEDCDKCELAGGRTQVVQVRGHIPCDVFFVGSGPGKSEDSVGQPFVGPAGRLLEEIIGKSGLESVGLTYGVGNLVACIPWNAERTTAVDPPPDEAILACRPRLEHLLTLADPVLVVTLGDSARHVFEEKNKKRIRVGEGVRLLHLAHPAGILRLNMAQQEAIVRRCVVQLQDTCEEITGVKR